MSSSDMASWRAGRKCGTTSKSRVVGCRGHGVDDLTLDGVDVLEGALLGKDVVHAEKVRKSCDARRETEEGELA